jgi:hypothetical protein
MDVLSLNLPPFCRNSHPYITYFDIKIIHQIIESMSLHTLCCHHCYYYYCYYYFSVDFVLFRNVTRYTNSLLSRIHVNIAHLLNITCILVATCMIARRRLDCIFCGSPKQSYDIQLLFLHSR